MFYTSHTNFIGIDPTAGQRPFAYAALDQDLRVLALGQGSMEEVLAFIAGQHQAFVAVCAPRRPSQGVMERAEVREKLSPQPRPGRWTHFRLAEYLLRQHNIRCPKTPSQEQACPNWMKMGFTLYQRMEAFGFCPYPAKDARLQWLEVYPQAAFCALLGNKPFPKSSLEGRIQRQLALNDQDLHIPDPMRFFEEITRHRLLQGILPTQDLYTPAELDALVAAFTAWTAASRPDQVTLLGDPQEGQITLPVKELKRRY